jgi:hypothetical protein
MEMHGCITFGGLYDIDQISFEHSSPKLKIWEATREELSNFLCKENVKINYNCSPLEERSDFDGS